MGIVPAFEDYKDKYEFCKMERDSSGVLEVRFHTNDDEFVWDFDTHEHTSYLFLDIGADPENKVIILTGTGEAFLRKADFSSDTRPMNAARWSTAVHYDGRRLIHSQLDIPSPMIAAINGPATCHAELGLLCDITLASEDAVFSDVIHFNEHILPGDGVHVLWPMLLGPNRGRYFLLTGEEISAQEAHDLGVVNEVMPRENLLPRARELAGYLLERPNIVRYLARHTMTMELKRAMNEHLGNGLALEGLAALDRMGS